MCHTDAGWEGGSRQPGLHSTHHGPPCSLAAPGVAPPLPAARPRAQHPTCHSPLPVAQHETSMYHTDAGWEGGSRQPGLHSTHHGPPCWLAAPGRCGGGRQAEAGACGALRCLQDPRSTAKGRTWGTGGAGGPQRAAGVLRGLKCLQARCGHFPRLQPPGPWAGRADVQVGARRPRDATRRGAWHAAPPWGDAAARATGPRGAWEAVLAGGGAGGASTGRQRAVNRPPIPRRRAPQVTRRPASASTNVLLLSAATSKSKSKLLP